MSSLMEHPVHNSAIIDRDLTQTGNPVDFSDFFGEIELNYVKFYDIAMKSFTSNEAIRDLEKLGFIDISYTDRDYVLKSIGIRKVLWLLKNNDSITVNRSIVEHTDINKLESAIIIYDIDNIGSAVIDKVNNISWNIFKNIIKNLNKKGYKVENTDNEYIKLLVETENLSIKLIYDTFGSWYRAIRLIATTNVGNDKAL
nr:MAG TPA: hypothetical protein [Caudoviricetes sp.]